MNAKEITGLAKERFREERKTDRLDGWFLAKETARECDDRFKEEPDCIRIARTEKEIMKMIPLSVSDYAVFAGTMDDSFARSYALINPAFEVEKFNGYCDPAAVFQDIEPNESFTAERIERLKVYNEHTAYADQLRRAYEIAGKAPQEAIFFVEQVSGHLIPDVRAYLKNGTEQMKKKLQEKSGDDYTKAMLLSIEALEILAARYQKIAEEKAKQKDCQDKERFLQIAKTLEKIPYQGAENLYEAIQFFMLIWQTMCLEQTPNPFAQSVGNADRIFEPYRQKNELGREESAALFKHLLVFFNVADRSWAISQNLIIGGRDLQGRDLTNKTSYALLDAYYEMNLPQPILSVKLHKNTPDELYRELGRFLFTPGQLTPSFFNDDAVFALLRKQGVEEQDIPDYAIAGCQEMLIMGKDNGNTTNSWLNLAKILELSIGRGKSLLTGEQFEDVSGYAENNKERLHHIREAFYQNLNHYVDQMTAAANAASEAIGLLQVPFLSTMMGGMESGVDVRDTKKQGTRYNGSGCLIHGLSVVADSFTAIDVYLKNYPDKEDQLVEALQHNFEGYEEIQEFLKKCPKYGNNMDVVDQEAVEIVNRVCDIVESKKNYLGNSFRCDFSSPSTHLLYGYWTGATPDGREARQMLGYGIDPLFGEASMGLGFRILSSMKLPFDRFNGGYASHFGINPGYFKKDSFEEKGMEFKEKIMSPLFFNPEQDGISPFYLYVNVTTPEMLRKVKEHPEKYAPSGVYIMRIHGTFVNFLDLSPAIQEDIIKRLDLSSTTG